jgi:hypothetical protein
MMTDTGTGAASGGSFCYRRKAPCRLKPAKSGSSPPSDLPDTDSTRSIGIRSAAASGFRALAQLAAEELPRGFGVRWLAGNGADTALAGLRRVEAKAVCALTPHPSSFPEKRPAEHPCSFDIFAE